MAKMSVAIVNAQAALIESTLGASPKLQIRTGAEPANCAAADSGTLLLETTLPADWLSAPANGVVSKAGAWTGTYTASGNAGHYRIKTNDGVTCGYQGSVSQRAADGGNGDMQLDQATVAVVSGQSLTVDTWSHTQNGI